MYAPEKRKQRRKLHYIVECCIPLIYRVTDELGNNKKKSMPSFRYGSWKAKKYSMLCKHFTVYSQIDS